MLPIGTNLKLNKLPKATLGLIAVNTVIFLGESMLPEAKLEWVFKTFGFGPGNLNPVAPFTSMFLHGDVFHLVFNMLFLWIFGGPVEERVGTKNFLIFYIGGGIAADSLAAVMDMLARPGQYIPGIGASGAISTIMALFLYRCFYSKLKMVITPLLLPRQINVPVIPLIVLWFLQNIIGAFISLSFNTGIGYWAHIGGFVFGLAVGRIKRYGQEGRVEQLREKIIAKLEKGGSLKTAERDLMRLLNTAPTDPEVHHDLARLHADGGDIRASEKFYNEAIRLYMGTNPLYGAYAVIEFMEKFGRPCAPQHHLKAAEALTVAGEVKEAMVVLAPFANSGCETNKITEKILALYIKLCRTLGRQEEAFEGIGVLMHNYPKSVFMAEVKAAMLASRDNILPKPKESQVKPGLKATDEAANADRLDRIELAQRVFADPALWSILVFLNIFCFVFARDLMYTGKGSVIIFVAAYVMTILHRTDMGNLLYFGRSQKQADHEFDVKKMYHDAVLSEKGGKYAEAAKLYEDVLKLDPKNSQARFNLARIYHKKLNDPRNARRHYTAITKHMPNEHPFHRDATDALQQLSPSTG